MRPVDPNGSAKVLRKHTYRNLHALSPIWGQMQLDAHRERVTGGFS